MPWTHGWGVLVVVAVASTVLGAALGERQRPEGNVALLSALAWLWCCAGFIGLGVRWLV